MLADLDLDRFGPKSSPASVVRSIGARMNQTSVNVVDTLVRDNQIRLMIQETKGEVADRFHDV